MLNGCRTESLMAISSVSLLPHRVAACCSSSLQRTLRPQSTALPIGPARTPPRELHYSALSFDIYALALGMHSGQRPAHGHPLLFMGIRGRNEARTLKRPWSDYCFSSSRLRNSGCRGGRASARSAGCREDRACIQAAADTIQEAVADDPALHLRMHVGLQGS